MLHIKNYCNAPAQFLYEVNNFNVIISLQCTNSGILELFLSHRILALQSFTNMTKDYLDIYACTHIHEYHNMHTGSYA